MKCGTCSKFGSSAIPEVVRPLGDTQVMTTVGKSGTTVGKSGTTVGKSETTVGKYGTTVGKSGESVRLGS